jgi:SulP family sulfate permease
LTGVNETVLKVMKRTHLLEKIGHDHIYHTPEQAIRKGYSLSHRDSSEKDCPLLAISRAENSSMEG